MSDVWIIARGSKKKGTRTYATARTDHLRERMWSQDIRMAERYTCKQGVGGLWAAVLKAKSVKLRVKAAGARYVADELGLVQEKLAGVIRERDGMHAVHLAHVANLEAQIVEARRQTKIADEAYGRTRLKLADTQDLLGGCGEGVAQLEAKLAAAEKDIAAYAPTVLMCGACKRIKEQGFGLRCECGRNIQDTPIVAIAGRCVPYTSDTCVQEMH